MATGYVLAGEDQAMGKRAEFSGRGSRSGTTQRIRVYALHEDQVELIKAALEMAREESGTEYDSVALTNICLAYLASGPPKRTPSSSRPRDHAAKTG